MVEIEAWRTIAGFNGKYQVSDRGRVRSLHKDSIYGEILKAPLDSTGYPVVNLGKRKQSVHGLVARTFLGPCPLGQEVRHKDGDPTNPALSNLEYGTRVQNKQDQMRHGRHTAGERHGCAKLTWDDVAEIRRLHAEGMMQKDIAPLFGVNRHNISHIVRWKTWRVDEYGNPVEHPAAS